MIDLIEIDSLLISYCDYKNTYKEVRWLIGIFKFLPEKKCNKCKINRFNYDNIMHGKRFKKSLLSVNYYESHTIPIMHRRVL